MRLWTTFLEPMLGVASHLCRDDGAEDIVKAHHCIVRNGRITVGETNGNSDCDSTLVNSKQLKLVSNGENTSLDVAKSCGSNVISGDTSAREDVDASRPVILANGAFTEATTVN
ncbi:hypothetical protein Nepgr_022534 [Nepenthes gracilis]|uniref:Uncharacterized protein n=1 Tax=Nepenthes gracilis TaxID=150966 RepID=A0AAD3T0H3_NEPGR|nr:hypothetical protein Nepgr_022534 [Nepenthes gracilis]